MKKKLFICGGHVTPALALIDELGRAFDIVFLGRTYAVEYRLVREKGIRFLPIVKIPIGFFQAFAYCLAERPQCIVSFGGYVALPVAIAGWMLHIPVITHEQTLALGRANRIIARIAKKVCVTHEETRTQFPSAVVTGLPMRKELFLPSKSISRSLIYITGGSQGAKSLNEKIVPALDELTKEYTVIHQTGQISYVHKKNYICRKYISLTELPSILQHAKIVIGRSGANTTMELAALGCVAILVPLPWSADNEQLAQATWLASHGGAVVIEQHELTKERLLGVVRTLLGAYDEYKHAAEEFSKHIPRDGAKRFAQEVRALV